MPAPAFLNRIVDRPFIRRGVDAFFSHYARRRCGYLNSASPAKLQKNTLFGLIRKAQKTQFGIDHGFSRIRSIADFQARVPPRDYEAFWKEYWQKPFPHLSGATWPSSIPYLALSSGTTSGTTKYIPISREMLASNKRAALTTLAFFLSSHPGTPIFSGRVFFLGGSTDLRDLSLEQNWIQMAESNGKSHSSSRTAPVLAGDLSGIATREVAEIVRPFTFPPLELALLKDWDQKMRRLAEQSAVLPITLLGGVPSWLLVLIERLLKVTNRSTVAEVWPSLRLIVHGGTKFDPYQQLFRQLVGNDQVHFQEIYPASEGFLAAADPRYELLRLIPDNGLFFEFIPVEELEKAKPARHTVENLEIGVQYAVAVTTCAGLWTYLIGDTVCFEKRNPPLLRFTGRTKYFLSAFGEHLISEEVEKAVAAAAEATGAAVVDFHVGPVFPESPSAPGRHRFFVEFAKNPADFDQFRRNLDQCLCQINEDYEAHRKGDLTMLGPEVVKMPRGGFADWLRSQGKMGGQHKVPRMDNSGTVTAQLSQWYKSSAPSP